MMTFNVYIHALPSLVSRLYNACLSLPPPTLWPLHLDTSTASNVLFKPAHGPTLTLTHV